MMYTALREQLIFEENERQRIRAKLSHINLVRIYLLVDDYVDFNEAHKSITKAFGCCTTEGDDEHVDLLSTMHSLLKEYASMKRTEMPLSKQIMRNERGPIAEAHLGRLCITMMIMDKLHGDDCMLMAIMLMAIMLMAMMLMAMMLTI